MRQFTSINLVNTIFHLSFMLLASNAIARFIYPNPP